MSETLDEKVKESVDDVFEMYSELFQDDDDHAINLFKNQLSDKVSEVLNLNFISEKLDILFKYEKNYLELLKEYKEEIKFAYTLQEDLRKERSKFFSSILNEVSSTLKTSQVDDSVAAKWIDELVGSYTKSLDASSGLIEESSLGSLNSIKSMTQEEIKAMD